MPQLRVKATAVLLRELHQDTVRRMRLLMVTSYSSARMVCLAQPTRLSFANTTRRR
jgi:hypothetical protein